MAGKTISAYTDTDTADRIESIAKREDRRKAQIAGMALKLFSVLPDEARTAWRKIETFGSPADMEHAIADITRILLNTQHEIATQQVVQEINTESLHALDTEDDLLATAVALTE
ncbi:hypothetical protein C1752_17100 [Acaryochloris thomasi RCC1774]|uniref:Uncharacterized protein n=1 Tax=Acaryochloris thomasi RCC1774 TaxID=1764569 RepID=A0A2W1JIV4_9CYAN|nr:hypothetical protein [Acaryochloris thomasi]PZD70194.1 hypothetical protein C1752_17100 [Acaryochloris thomasi RCC1774]